MARMKRIAERKREIRVIRGIRGQTEPRWLQAGSSALYPEINHEWRE